MNQKSSFIQILKSVQRVLTSDSPDCQNQVSTRATSCPNCGCILTVQPNKFSGNTWLLLGGACLLFGYGAVSISLGRMAIPSDLKLLTGIGPPSCTSIISQIYNLSHDEKVRNDGITIVQITPTKTVEQTETSVTCIGTAKLSNTSNILLEYKSYPRGNQHWVEYQEVIN